MSDRIRFEGLTLTVESVERSIAFYRDRLGFEVPWNAAPAFAMLRLGAGTIGLLSIAEARKEGVADSTPEQKRAIHVELVRRLREADAAGVTTLRGIWGFHGEHVPHGDRLLSLRRHVPVMTIAIDTPARMATLFPIFDELTGEQGLLTSEIVPAMAASGRGEIRGGLRLANTNPS